MRPHLYSAFIHARFGEAAPSPRHLRWTSPPAHSGTPWNHAISPGRPPRPTSRRLTWGFVQRRFELKESSPPLQGCSRVDLGKEQVGLTTTIGLGPCTSAQPLERKHNRAGTPPVFLGESCHTTVSVVIVSSLKPSTL